MWLTLCFWDDFSQSLLQWNNTKTMPLHSQHHTALNNLLANEWHSLKYQIFLNKLTNYEKHYSPKLDAMTSASFRLCHCKIPPLTHFPLFPLVARLHQPVFLHFHRSSRFAAHYKFTATNYYSNFVISRASQQQNHLVYWLNPVQFYYK